MKTTILIFSSRRSLAEQKLTDLLEEWNEQVIRRTADMAETETRYVRALTWSDNKRACRANEIHIDHRITRNERNMITSLVRPKDMFGAEWNWKEHIHYY